MKTETQRNSSDCANGDAVSVSTAISFVRRDRRSAITSRRAGTSNTSFRHSRVVSSSIGNVGCFAASLSRSALRWRCIQSGVRLPGPLAGEQQRPSARLAEGAGEHRGARERGDDGFLDLVGIEYEVLDGDPVHGLGQAHDDAVVAPQHLRARTEPIEQPLLDRESPRGVHPLPERREEAHPPVAELVAEPLDHDGAVVGHGTGRLDLVVEVRDEVPGGALVETEVGLELREGGLALGPAQLAGERADRASQLDRTPGLVALPERHLPGLTGRR